MCKQTEAFRRQLDWLPQDLRKSEFPPPFWGCHPERLGHTTRGTRRGLLWPRWCRQKTGDSLCAHRTEWTNKAEAHSYDEMLAKNIFSTLRTFLGLRRNTVDRLPMPAPHNRQESLVGKLGLPPPSWSHDSRRPPQPVAPRGSWVLIGDSLSGHKLPQWEQEPASGVYRERGRREVGPGAGDPPLGSGRTSQFLVALLSHADKQGPAHLYGQI